MLKPVPGNLKAKEAVFYCR